MELSFNQNFLTLEYSALNYLNPFQTRYRYQLAGIDNDWMEVFSGSENFRTNGILSVSYTNLPPGEYLFRVMASDNNNQWDATASELKIIIHAPWWKTKTAYALYAISVLLIMALSVFLYLNYTRKKWERKHREELLLQRIRHLIQQQQLLEGEKESNTSKKATNLKHSEGTNPLSPADAEFLSRAIKVVEQNLYEPNYSVAQLSRDLCMDRTGLYRKLILLMDKSPSSFIRRIRLQRAARLILEEDLSITEVAEKVGFSSSSYFSKCFQEMYGCRPSEYAENIKNST
ncbi:transcriptional regulator [Geofilum rubicundum JCM 15548]|uniref:Transcriptional regulator n=1 Tax=Geofilum rubicundum JCM 15548 TaxID=1236989 RepID=A0A0E9LTX8_9BACT|nr:transcriptional regulator [Geofilum rubicundum JCM 15548]